MNVPFPVLSEATYRIESELGSGGSGVVYKAWHTRLQKYVVIKELKRSSKNDLETQRNEVEALKNVKSEYLPQVFDFLTEEDRIFTVIEFVEGESLDKSLERGQKFSQPQVVKWYGQLTSALEAIHKQNVCHRDIKPANIMLTPAGNICLIDFNAALVSGNDVKLISRSLGYASPEQYEIYDRYKNANSAPINYGSSNVSARVLTGTKTEFTDDDENTEFVDDNQATEFVDDQKTEHISSPIIDSIDWKRSDIYSLGATIYHLLTGKYPSERAAEVTPVSKLGKFSEGLVFIIEQSMRLNPTERFASVKILNEVIQNIHKHDTRWKVLQSKMVAAAIILPLAFVLFAGIALFGNRVMVQEKEERYYDAVLKIMNDNDFQTQYNDALSIYWDRIDPYRAMAERLWNDGDIYVCKKYIEENLGNISKFQAVPEAQRSFGDIYFILGNCYYYQSGEPNYNTARGNFEIAVQYVKDNPIYYRNYAISLARTGYVSEAESILEKAYVLNLDIDSLNLLNGEIAFARQKYDNAVQYFDKVILSTGDDYVRYRAYHTSDEIFKLLGQPERSVTLLSGALNKIPLNRVPEMTERLADAYVRSGDYINAIILFERLLESGAPQFHLYHGLVILFQNVGDFDRAASMLYRMTSLFPNDYRISMRQAFLEADRQSRIDIGVRDYGEMEQYYFITVRLYNENVRPGESDPEMQQLELIIEQLQIGGWID
jgi:serine/threonine-protein kinase